MPTIPINEGLLDEKLTELEQAKNWSPRVISRLETTIRTADDYDLFRLNPIRFATDKNMVENEAIDLFLYGVKAGLFDMEWHLICPFCTHVVKSLAELNNLHAHFICNFCDAESTVSLDDYIHVSFTISPQVRQIAYHQPETLDIRDYYLRYHFCKGVLPFPGGYTFESVFNLITKLMTYVAPQERHTLAVELPPGMLQVKDLSKSASVTFFVGQASQPAPTLDLRLQEGQMLVGGQPVARQRVELPLAPFHFRLAGESPSGPVTVDFSNHMASRCPLWVLHYPAEFQGSYAQFEPFLSGKRLLTNQTFRNLFRSETIEADEGIGVKDITFLFTDLKGSTALYDRIGDLKAYYLVRQHFDTLERVVARNSGAVVKTIGDAVMASFMNPLDAIKAAVEMLQEIETFNRTISDDIILKIGVHRGPSIAVTLNDRLDYFGQTVNIAARVQGLAGAGEIYVTWDTHQYPGVDDLLTGCEIVPEQANVKGVSDRLDVCKITTPASG
jgi:class 3 adenylate cyclase